jgi:D-methionine transport system permease protein
MPNDIVNDLFLAFAQTLYMVTVSGCMASLLGIPLGIALFVTAPEAILASRRVQLVLALAINSLRSLPFIILLIAIIPFTRLLIGSSIGTTAAIVPLTVAAIPFIARIVNNALAEVAYGLIEMGLALGASSWQIVRKILLPEAMPGIVNGLTLTLINLVGYSAMAGAIGGGGLGDLAIRYGYQRFEPSVMLLTIVVLIGLVQFIQMLGDKIVRTITKY